MAENGTRLRLSARVYNLKERDRAKAIFATFDPDVHTYDGLVTGWGDSNVARQLMDAGFFLDASSYDKTDPLPPPIEQDLTEPLSGGLGEFSDTIQHLEVIADQHLEVIADSGSRPITAKARRFGPGSAARTITRSFLSVAARLLHRPQMDPTRVMYEVRLVGPMRPEWGRKLAALGEVASYCPPFRYRMLLTLSQANTARKLDFVQAATRYSLGDTLGRDLLKELQLRRPGETSDFVDLDLTLHYPSQASTILSMLKEHPRFTVLETAGPSIRFTAPIDDPFLITLADREQVKTVEIHKPASLLIDIGRNQIGISAVNSNGNPVLWDGADEVVGIIDSGIDRNHPDLSEAVSSYQHVIGATTTDTVGHGTHVAGIVAGSGQSSGGKIKGVAPGAKLTVVGIVNSNGTPIFPSDLTAVLQSATNDGARIVNLSVGRKETNGRYDDWAQSLDTFVRNNPEVLIVVAAGNDGTATNGYPDYQTVNSPATANNVITAGACGSVRPGISTSWGIYNASRFPAPPVSAALMAGAPSSPAALSSRGPTQYGTLKPDVLAPGTFILSTKAAASTMASVAPVPPGADRYMFLHGSSMAAPFVSGAAAVLRQYLRKAMNVQAPSAALMKAILCASACRGPQMVNPGKPTLNGYPDFDQGFGTLNLAMAIPHVQGQTKRLVFADVANDSANALASRQPDMNPATRSTRSYRFKVGQGAGPFRVILTWTDTPGPGVKNILLLDVKGPGVALVGNHEYNYSRDGLFNTLGIAGIPYDTKSNVQTVNITAPAVGDYYANVFAYETHEIGGKQGYAVCVCGDLDSDLLPVLPVI